MLNFIILGFVPGTHEQLSFFNLLLVVLGLVVLFSIVLLVRAWIIRQYSYPTQETDFNLISL